MKINWIQISGKREHTSAIKIKLPHRRLKLRKKK
ncbi:hypothetical protein ACQ46_gp060 [Citrobacter phage Moon]|uniref:Uncharacterized protein n=1 Tax=Citrobacter phage Moon TaxID=1540095 RepID=A0A0A0YQ31_9CAUD|nr:hypothetical protein ACQ46_gp060 [Citrobacter phage Moon]YP_010843936.1 hypothetical protein PP427_gp080 [Salmonella phage KM16]AIX12031.1 hypothetical protein CPT_Moon60 [Citrobacter phage Moon]